MRIVRVICQNLRERLLDTDKKGGEFLTKIDLINT